MADSVAALEEIKERRSCIAACAVRRMLKGQLAAAFFTPVGEIEQLLRVCMCGNLW